MVDYIIVGGGSAGCILAARLSEDRTTRVLLLEAGPPDRNPYIHIPVGFFKMTAGPLTWGLRTCPQDHAMNREIPYAQARVLGGGSSINAQVYTRGCPQDYDGWERDFGCHGWSYRDVLPYFVRCEDNDTFAGPGHGTGGPQGVSSHVHPHRLARAFVQSCQQYGMPLNQDFNGDRQEGAGTYQTTTRAARRCSTAVGYLAPARGRPNLAVRTGAFVTRIVVERGRATGVEIREDGRATVLRAEREVIVAAGAIGSPRLMMLSGLGPADELGSVGITVQADLPGVGRNFHDHFGIDIVAELNGPYSLDKYARRHWMLWAGLEYALFRKGPATSNLVEAGAFWYADRQQASPDLQFHFLVGAGVEEGVPKIESGSGITLNSYAVRPRARGTVRLTSNDPSVLPRVDPNFLGDEEDVRTAVEGIRISREIMSQPALARYVRKEHFPGSACRTPAEMEDYARRYGRTSYHPVGTCRMGVDGLAVVDPALRVHGIDGLRICDSSTMPRLVSSNTNAAVIMMAEKGSDLILGNEGQRETVAHAVGLGESS
jgi:choline dehydrogenase